MEWMYRNVLGSISKFDRVPFNIVGYVFNNTLIINFHPCWIKMLSLQKLHVCWNIVIRHNLFKFLFWKRILKTQWQHWSNIFFVFIIMFKIYGAQVFVQAIIVSPENAKWDCCHPTNKVIDWRKCVTHYEIKYQERLNISTRNGVLEFSKCLIFRYKFSVFTIWNIFLKFIKTFVFWSRYSITVRKNLVHIWFSILLVHI